MNILLLGAGGRENALAYKISESSILKNLFTAPGNPGTEMYGKNVNLNYNDHKILLEFCKQNKIDLVLIGPEKPLVDGVSDILRKNGITVFGPNKKAAEIEGYKSFAKNLMKKYSIPTADFVEFSNSNYDGARRYLAASKFPVVLKADGLAAGKGVIIAKDFSEAVSALDLFFVKNFFGESGAKIIIEEFLTGEEASIFAVTDGENFLCLPPVQDYKRIGEHDTGKNTGGMGSYSPAPVITDELMQQISEEIIKPTLTALRNEERNFIGCLYCGLMITEAGPKVIEYNCRFGDPETQAVLPLIKGDFLELLYSTAKGEINKSAVSFADKSSICIVAASQGYPDQYRTGFEIKGLSEFNEKDILVFHAGTKLIGADLLTNGGRVLNVVAVMDNKDFRTAKMNAYSALKKIHFEGIYYRHDIGDRAVSLIENSLGE